MKPRPSILLVDDDAPFRQVLRGELSRMGFEVTAVGSGEDALAKVAEVEPDVIGEAFEELCSLGHSESDARRLIDAALKSKKKFKDVGDLIAAIYDQSKS